MRWAALVAAVIAAFAGPAPAGDGGPVVVELFTSQGCSACPPADAFLAELAARPGVLALSLHVDYWNYLGWRDTFSSPAHTRRQRDYADAWGARMLFTPQMVVNGAQGLVGSDRDAVEAAIAAAPPPSVPVRLRPEGDMIRAEVGAVDAPAEVHFVVYDHPATVLIAQGENGGRELSYANVVRVWAALGFARTVRHAWLIPAPAEAQGVAVLVQAVADRRILGAARLDNAR